MVTTASVTECARPRDRIGDKSEVTEKIKRGQQEVSPGKQDIKGEQWRAKVEYPGAVYHLMGRGNQGKPIFRNDADRLLFLDTLSQGCEKTGWEIHAYVLMSNHYHVLLETPETNLLSGMKRFQGTNTQRYNRRYKVFGHLVHQGVDKAVGFWYCLVL